MLTSLQKNGFVFAKARPLEVRDSHALLRKSLSVTLCVGKPCMSSDIATGFDNAGIRVEKIVSIQRNLSNNTWTVAFIVEDAKASALAVPSISVAGCQVFVADSEHSTVVVKLYEIPFEMPDSAVIGMLSHYGRVLLFAATDILLDF